MGDTNHALGKCAGVSSDVGGDLWILAAGVAISDTPKAAG
ncbi:hypothetical protein GCM10027213_58980 [Mycobacterium bourgelatii]